MAIYAPHIAFQSNFDAGSGGSAELLVEGGKPILVHSIVCSADSVSVNFFVKDSDDVVLYHLWVGGNTTMDINIPSVASNGIKVTSTSIALSVSVLYETSG